MISHKYRCIFIHIPRTAGSSIERWIHGDDWWGFEAESKHLIASQAKQKYAEYWDDYFKFSFVRNPWDRIISCMRWPGHFGVRWIEEQGRLDLSRYTELFGSPITVEHDHRFSQRSDLLNDHHLPGQVYLNMLDEEIDFIAKFETLADDCKFIRRQLGLRKRMKIHVNQSDRNSYQHYYDEEARRLVGELYAGDIERFGYQF